jgi:hypothetical protein
VQLFLEVSVMILGLWSAIKGIGIIRERLYQVRHRHNFIDYYETYRLRGRGAVIFGYGFLIAGILLIVIGLFSMFVVTIYTFTIFLFAFCTFFLVMLFTSIISYLVERRQQN